jgi:hypothetical protein
LTASTARAAVVTAERRSSRVVGSDMGFLLPFRGARVEGAVARWFSGGWGR